MWRLRFEDEREFALKLGVQTAPARKEAGMLAALATCPVSRVVASGGEGAGWLLTEWAGSQTLDGALPSLSSSERNAVGMGLVRAVLSVEEVLERRANIDGGRRELARQALAQQVAMWAHDALNSLLWLLEVGVRGFSLSGKVTDQPSEAVEAVLAAALSAAPRLGSLDYNPRNVVLGSRQIGALTLIDFPAVGFDWTERRLAQYATATGTREAGGRFATALDAEVAAEYAKQAARPAGHAGSRGACSAGCARGVVAAHGGEPTEAGGDGRSTGRAGERLGERA